MPGQLHSWRARRPQGPDREPRPQTISRRLPAIRPATPQDFATAVTESEIALMARYLVQCSAPSFDNKWHARYPAGNAPQNVFTAAATARSAGSGSQRSALALAGLSCAAALSRGMPSTQILLAGGARDIALAAGFPGILGQTFNFLHIAGGIRFEPRYFVAAVGDHKLEDLEPELVEARRHQDRAHRRPGDVQRRRHDGERLIYRCASDTRR